MYSPFEYIPKTLPNICIIIIHPHLHIGKLQNTVSNTRDLKRTRINMGYSPPTDSIPQHSHVLTVTCVCVCRVVSCVHHHHHHI